jgi:hypothetical protein
VISEVRSYHSTNSLPYSQFTVPVNCNVNRTVKFYSFCNGTGQSAKRSRISCRGFRATARLAFIRTKSAVRRHRNTFTKNNSTHWNRAHDFILF